MKKLLLISAIAMSLCSCGYDNFLLKEDSEMSVTETRSFLKKGEEVMEVMVHVSNCSNCDPFVFYVPLGSNVKVGDLVYWDHEKNGIIFETPTNAEQPIEKP